MILILILLLVISLLYYSVAWVVVKVKKWHFPNFRDRMYYYFDANFRLFSDMQMLYQACCVSENCSIPYYKSEAERMLESWSHYYRVRANLLLSYEDLFVEYFNVPIFTNQTFRSLMWRLRYKESKVNVVAAKPFDDDHHAEVDECKPQMVESQGYTEIKAKLEAFFHTYPNARKALTKLVDLGLLMRDFSIPPNRGAKIDAILAMYYAFYEIDLGEKYLEVATMLWPSWSKENIKSLKRKGMRDSKKSLAIRKKLHISE